MTNNYYQFSIGKSGPNLQAKATNISFGNGLFEESVTGCIEESPNGELRIFLSGYTYDSHRTTSDNLLFSGEDLEAGIEKFTAEAGKKIKSIPKDYFYSLTHVISICMEIGRSDDKEPAIDTELDEETWRWASFNNYGEIEIDDNAAYSGALFLQILPRYDRNPEKFTKNGFASFNEEGREGGNIWIGYYLVS